MKVTTMKLCSPSRVARYTAKHKPRCVHGIGCTRCWDKYNRVNYGLPPDHGVAAAQEKNPIHKGPPSGDDVIAFGGASHDVRVPPNTFTNGSLVGSSGKVTPRQYILGEYEVRQRKPGKGKWGIYHRGSGERVARFESGDCFVVRITLAQMFEAAHQAKVAAIKRFRSDNG
jgi:hypothetical protein